MKKVLLLLIILFTVFFFWVRSWMIITPPPIDENSNSFASLTVDTVSVTHYSLDRNYIRKRKEGLWEMYTEGNPYEIGHSVGILAKDLLYNQEKAFVDQIKEIIPSNFYLHFLKYLIGFFNRNLDQNIIDEYCQEIYGMSKESSDEFNDIGPAYQRLLNYHGAHDIGHALQEMALVGCTSFALKGHKSDDGSLLVGRNFDFYVGDEFAKEKIIHFVNPEKGYKFASVTWGGFVGVVSGMNETGLTVTINAAESEMPSAAATPISLIAREILQYAKTTAEAYSIAMKRQAFVSEAILVTSAIDGTSISIEKSPSAIDSLGMNNDKLLTTNHYKSASMKLPIAYDTAYSSFYRYQRLSELITQKDSLSVKDAAHILRDKKGLQNKDIGLGNEKAVNQLIAHHAVIFKPETKEMWLSCTDFQLGEFIYYNLDSVFSEAYILAQNTAPNKEKNIQQDSFVSTSAYKQFLLFRSLIKDYKSEERSTLLSRKQIAYFISLNPNSYYTYEILGDAYSEENNNEKATFYYKKALEKEIATHHEMENIKSKISSLKTNNQI